MIPPLPFILPYTALLHYFSCIPSTPLNLLVFYQPRTFCRVALCSIEGWVALCLSSEMTLCTSWSSVTHLFFLTSLPSLSAGLRIFQELSKLLLLSLICLILCPAWEVTGTKTFHFLLTHWESPLATTMYPRGQLQSQRMGLLCTAYPGDPPIPVQFEDISPSQFTDQSSLFHPNSAAIIFLHGISRRIHLLRLPTRPLCSTSKGFLVASSSDICGTIVAQ